jgi:hypothetical protein
MNAAFDHRNGSIMHAVHPLPDERHSSVKTNGRLTAYCDCPEDGEDVFLRLSTSKANASYAAKTTSAPTTTIGTVNMVFSFPVNVCTIAV